MNHSNTPSPPAGAPLPPACGALEVDRKTLRQRANSRVKICGFTLLEVMVASAVLILGIVSAITTLQRGFQSLDSARNLTVASQVMQSEMERMRLKNWSQIEAMQTAGTTELTTEDARFVCTLAINDLKTDMKEIILQASWQGYDGRPQTARLITRYGKSGLNDYFYTSH